MNCPACGFSANTSAAVVCTICGEELQRAREALPRGRRGLSLRLEGGRQQWVLVRAGAAPVLLDAGETFTLGRARDCDLVVPSQQVSRIHAEIGWKGKRPVLRDLGSENGTQVNGDSVRQHALSDWDRISLGGHELTARRVTGEKVSTTYVLEKLGAVDPVPTEGALEGASLVALLGQLERQEASGTVHVEGTPATDGSLTLAEGLPTQARSGELGGEQAVYQLLAQEEGRYRFVSGEPSRDPALARSLTALLMQHADRMDGRHTLPLRKVDLGDLEDE